MFRALRQAWQNRALVGDANLQTQELDFLPAALEIKERPPHPASRITSYLLMSLFLIGILWASFGEVNIVAVAEGKIVPSGQVKLIQPYEKGIVAELLVKDGQAVKQGEALIILDRKQTAANVQRLTQELQQNNLNNTRLQALLDFLSSTPADTNELQIVHEKVLWPEDAELLDQQQQSFLLQQQITAYQAEQNRLVQQKNDKQAEQDVQRALIAKLENTLPLISQRTQALKTMMQKQIGSKSQFLELEQERVEQIHDLNAAKARLEQLNAQLADLIQQQAMLKAQTSQNVLQEVVELSRQRVGLEEESKKAQDLNGKQILVAPVDGVIQELAVHTVGGVVTPAQELMKIVPENRKLVVEAWLENKDIGFVFPGQSAEVKINTFPFTKYGVIDARVENISGDATNDEQRGLIYKTSVLLDRNTIMVDGREVNLVPGMSVSAEVKTGKRLLIEYVLTPLLRYKNESVRER